MDGLDTESALIYNDLPSSRVNRVDCNIDASSEEILADRLVSVDGQALSVESLVRLDRGYIR